jgi:DnaJ homolog subfamily C member 7
MFGDCLDLDELNVQYNATIYFNMALALIKQDKNEDALKYLNKAVQSNPKYAKAFYKRGEINQKLSNHEEALRDFQTASNLEPSEYKVDSKIRDAQAKAKEAAKKDYYKILGLEKGATDEQIKKAYRKMAMKYHPDRNQGGTDEDRLKAEKMFKDVNEANDVLTDPKKKQQFDMGMYDPTGGAGGFDMGGMGGMGGMGIDPSMLF